MITGVEEQHRTAISIGKRVFKLNSFLLARRQQTRRSGCERRFTAGHEVAAQVVAEGCLISPSFGHIFSGGYAAGYYGYKWAELLDADAFAAFQETGIFNKKTADKFHKMLESGGSVDPSVLYKEFRGKEPTVDALLRRDGIKK